MVALPFTVHRAARAYDIASSLKLSPLKIEPIGWPGTLLSDRVRMGRD
jgi:hypothetical protein